ncbi:MAG TPA: hypothetical protein EYN44_19435 [Marinobacter salarius]|jgi:hypothetical protein|nr:hypothetical protein [Marinobacter salarius]HIP01750.1 hypothetical protein [Marinobacter salarius]
MGWGDCGTDSQGRPIGYVHPATCDHPGCSEQIDRGLSYVCGDMHGEDEVSCEKYFCSAHRSKTVHHEASRGELLSVCDQCAAELIESGEWFEDELEGVIRPCEA